jgi:hypothetical protein
MRKVLLTVVLVFAGACTTQSKSAPPPGAALPSPTSSGNTTGAPSAKGAVEGFLAAVKSQDLQAMSMIWGTEDGLARELMSREELEKRLVVMQCNLNHDSWSYAAGLDGTTRAGEEDLRIELRQKNLKEQTIVTAVRGKNGRWFVKNIDLTKLNEFCR